MLDAAAKDGVFLNFSPQQNYGSGYRTRAGSAKALSLGGDNAVAQPGESTHNLGAGVDFYGLDEKALRWLQANGPDYRFYGYSEKGEGTPNMTTNVGDFEYHHWDYRPDIKETN